MDYRTRRQRSAGEIAERWQEAKEHRERVVALVVARDARAARACASHVPLRWADHEWYKKLAKVFTEDGASLMTNACLSSAGAAALRHFVEEYTTLPARLRAEKYPPVIVPGLPERPQPGRGEEVERREAELDAALTEYGRIEQGIDDDQRDLERLEEAVREERATLERKHRLYRVDQCKNWIQMLEQTLERSPWAAEPEGSLEPRAPSELSRPVSMRAPTVWLTLGLGGLVVAGLLVAVDELPFVRGFVWISALFALTAGTLAWRRRRHLPEPRKNKSARGRGARWSIGLFVAPYLGALAVTLIVLGAKAYAGSTWFVVLGLVTSGFALPCAVWLALREYRSIRLLRLAHRAPAIVGRVVDGTATRTRDFAKVTTHHPFMDKDGRQQTSTHWEWSESGGATGDAIVELDDGMRAKLDLTKAAWGSTRVRVRENGGLKETLEAADKIVAVGAMRQDGDELRIDAGPHGLYVVATEDQSPRTALARRMLAHWGAVAAFVALALGGSVLSWWNPVQTRRVYRGSVAESAVTGVAASAACVVDLRYVEDDFSPSCQLQVRCAGRVLFGGVGYGFARCSFDKVGRPEASDLDASDGDGAISFDVARGHVVIWDELDRRVRIELEE